jgi:hypothetical protein
MQKTILAGKVAAQPLQPSARHGIEPGVDHGDPPRLGVVAVIGDVAPGRIHRHVRRMQHVVGEILLDHVATIAERDDEVCHAVRRIDVHDMPQYRPATDLDHGLWPQMRFLADARALATGEDHRLQDAAPTRRRKHFGQ